MTKKFLTNTIRRSYKTISNAVDFLESDGHIQRVGYRTWTLPNGQLPLPGFETPLPAPSIPSIPSSIPTVRNDAGSDDVCTARGEICADPSAIRAQGDDVRPEPVKRENLPFETGNFTVSPTTTTTTEVERVVVVGRVESETGKFTVSPQLAVAFHNANIGQNVWRELASYPWVTPRYVRAMHARIRNHPNPDKRNGGFLVHCIRSHDPEPEWCEECERLNGEHALECSAGRARYIRGKYADQIEH